MFSDGSTNVNHYIAGAAAVLRDVGQDDIVEVCSYTLFITGAETSEHLGLACSLNVILKWLDRRADGNDMDVRCVLHGDNLQAWGRYEEGAPLPAVNFGYLHGLIVLNKERLQRLQRAGVTFEWRHVPSAANPAHTHALRAQQSAVGSGEWRNVALRGRIDEKLLDIVNRTGQHMYLNDAKVRKRWGVQGFWTTHGHTLRVSGDDVYFEGKKWARIFLCARNGLFCLEKDGRRYSGESSEFFETLDWDDGDVWHHVWSPSVDPAVVLSAVGV